MLTGPDIRLIAPDHPRWQEISSFAARCSWRAGPALAEKMENRDFLPWERVCAAWVDGNPAGFCSFHEKDELPETYGFQPFIGFVFVAEPYRGRRLSQDMIRTVLPYARRLGHDRVYLMSGEVSLYEKYGFQKLGDYETIFGTVDSLFTIST